jgi:isocitrate dehydrogenase
MMLRYLGWTEAADLVVASLERAIAARTVTYDLARMIPGSTELKTSAFASAMIGHM